MWINVLYIYIYIYCLTKQITLHNATQTTRDSRWEYISKINVGKVKVKVKVILKQAIKIHRGSISLPTLFTFGDWWVGCKAPRPGRFSPGKNNRQLSWRRLAGLIVSVEGCGKSRPQRDSIPGWAKIENCSKVTNKHKTKNTVEKTNNLRKTQYLFLFLPFLFHGLTSSTYWR